jgi:hypothetical protein
MAERGLGLLSYTEMCNFTADGADQNLFFNQAQPSICRAR